MSLHARNIAIAAGATDELIDLVAEKMVVEHKIRMDRAKELIEQYKGTGKSLKEKATAFKTAARK
jgi:hydroxymethylglutaryl-CoA reductase